MATVDSQHVRRIGRYLGFFENILLRKISDKKLLLSVNSQNCTFFTPSEQESYILS